MTRVQAIKNSVQVYIFLAEFFTTKNIIEPLLNHYKSFDYIKHMLTLDFDEGWELYEQGVKRIDNLVEEHNKKYCWDLYLIEIQHGYEDNFDKYYKSKITSSLSKLDEKDIIDKYKVVDTKRLKRRLLE